MNLLVNVFFEVEAVFHALKLADGLRVRFKQLDVRDPVNAVVRKVVISVIVAHEVIPSVRRGNLVRIYDILSVLAILRFAVVKLFVCPEFVIVEPHLLSQAYRLVEHFDRQEKRVSFRSHPVDRRNVRHARPEKHVRKPLKLFDKLLLVRLRDMI